MPRTRKETPQAPATVAEAKAPAVTPVVPEATPLKAKDVPLLKDTAVLAQHRDAIVTLMTDVAVTRQEAAELNQAAKDAYAKIDAATLAYHYASIAAELVRAYPMLEKTFKLWSGMWTQQLRMIVATIFEKETTKDASGLTGRLGQDATRFGLTFYYCKEVIEPWTAKRYGVAPDGIATIGAAVAVARARKAKANPKNDTAITKVWDATRKKLGSVAELKTFLSIAQREIKVAAEKEAAEAVAKEAAEAKAAEAVTPVAVNQ